MPIAPSTYYAAQARGPVSDTDWADAQRRVNRRPAVLPTPYTGCIWRIRGSEGSAGSGMR